MVERFAWSLIMKTMTWKRVPVFLRQRVKDELYRLVQEDELYEDYYNEIIRDLEELEEEEARKRAANTSAGGNDDDAEVKDE